MTDIATLGIKIDTADAKQATAALKGFEQQAAQTEKQIIALQRAAVAQGAALGTAIGTGLGRAITFAVQEVGQLAKAFFDLSKEVAKYQDLADKTGASAAGIASLRTSADVAGVSIDSVANSLVRLSSVLSKTDEDSKGAGRALAAIGITVKDFKALAPDEQYRKLAQALDKYADGGSKVAIVTALLGRAGADQLKVLKELANETSRVSILTDAQIKIADDFGDAQARSKSQLLQYLEALSVSTLPAVTAFTSSMTEVVRGLLEVDSATGKFNGSTAVRNWAETGAIFLATFVDSLRNTALEIRAFIAETQSEFSKLKVGAALLAAAPGLPLFSIRDQIGSVSDALDEQTAAAKRSKEAALDLAKGGSQFADTVRRTLESQRRASFTATDPRRLDVDPNGKPTIDTTGLNKPKSGGLGIDKAQLNADLDLLRNALAEQNNIYKNAQTILDAERAAGFVQDKDYYEQKRLNIELTEAAELRELQAENARLAQATDTARQRIDNDRKIADNERKMTTLRADNATKARVLDIQERESLNAIAAAYVQAEEAAKSYLDSLVRAQGRDLVGLNRGDATNARDAGRQQIQDRYSDQRSSLEANRRALEAQRDADGNTKFGAEQKRRYDEELARIDAFEKASLDSYAAYTASRLDLESQWQTGASKAIANYLDEVANLAKQTQDLTTKAIGGIEDAFVSLATTGKEDFKSLANSIIADIVRIQAKAAIAGLLKYFDRSTSFAAFDTNGSSTNFTGGSLPTAGGAATGTNFVERDMLTILHQGEAVIPKAYNPAANLGAMSAQRAAPDKIQIVNNGAPVMAREETEQQPDGSTLRRLILDTTAADIGSGTGKTSQALRSRHGVGPGNLVRRN